jgi:hypothetical protein
MKFLNSPSNIKGALNANQHCPFGVGDYVTYQSVSGTVTGTVKHIVEIAQISDVESRIIVNNAWWIFVRNEVNGETRCEKIISDRNPGLVRFANA